MTNIVIFSMIIISIFISIVYKNKKSYKNTLEMLKNDWGNDPKKDLNLKNTKKIYNYLQEDNLSTSNISDQVWNDLNLDQMYKKLDHCKTECGEYKLYSILRCPLLNKNTLQKRNEIITYFMKNKDISLQINKVFYDMGKSKTIELAYLLKEKLPTSKFGERLAYGGFILSLISLSCIPFWGLKSILIILPVLVINSIITTWIHKKVFQHQFNIFRLNHLLIAAEKINAMKIPVLKNNFEDLDILLSNIKSTKRSMKKLVIPSTIGNDPTGIVIYLNYFFLFDCIVYFKAIKLINKHQQDLKNIYNILGEVEALLSVASYKTNKSKLVTPLFTNNNDIVFKANDICHPLLNDPISNDICMETNGLFITGSNMAGKSTFMRTIGINTLLAQTLYFVHGSYYEAPMFQIMTSITTTDDINNAKSYYLMEAELIGDIISKIDSKVPTLIIIDELFRGTNSVERIEASYRILNYLVSKNTFTVVATHDLQLKDKINDNFETYYFNEFVSNDVMKFDYKIKKGVVQKGNALEILRILNYPKEIIS